MESLVDSLDKQANFSYPSYPNRNGYALENIQNFNEQVNRHPQLTEGQVYQYKSGQLVQMQNVPEFNETILSTHSSDSLVGIALGTALSSGVAGMFSGIFGQVGLLAGMGTGFTAAIVGWLLMKKVLKSGFGHSIAKGVFVGGVASIAFPMVQNLIPSLSGATSQ